MAHTRPMEEATAVLLNGESISFSPGPGGQWSGQLYEVRLPGRSGTASWHEAILTAFEIADDRVFVAALSGDDTRYSLEFAGTQVDALDLDDGVGPVGDDISLLEWGWPDRFLISTTHVELRLTAKRLDYRVCPPATGS